MPITVDRDDERRRLVARATGTLTVAELVEFVRTERTGNLSQYQLFFDATTATARATPQDARLLAHQVITDSARTGGVRGPVAIIANDALLDLALAYEALCHGAGLHVIRVFRSIEEAEQWLGW